MAAFNGARCRLAGRSNGLAFEMGPRFGLGKGGLAQLRSTSSVQSGLVVELISLDQQWENLLERALNRVD